MLKVGFLFTRVGLEVTFRDISREVPVGSTYHWDFGDSNVAEGEKNPVNTFDLPGFYLVTLTVTAPPLSEGGDPIIRTNSQVVGLNTTASTVLPDTIYNLIDYLVPVEFMDSVNFTLLKRSYIEKWQLYIQPLVNHDIPIEEFNNELMYEALENQLIMELAVFSWVSDKVLSFIGSISSNSNTSSQNDGGEIKHIITGPSEVEFFSDNDIKYKTLVAATKKDGVIEIIKQNLCMLSQRLDIYLPICSMVRPGNIVPEVSNRRSPGRLGGPNPTYPLKK